MDAASLYGCTGWVRNEWDGSVTILKDADVIDHSLSNIFGEGSPIGKLYELNGDVLLIGVGYDKNTSLHLADVRAVHPGKHDSDQ